MNIKHILLTGAVAGMLFSNAAMAMGLGLGDQYNPYVTADEVMATPTMRTPAEERLADQYNPYILSNEIVATKGCRNPADELVADRFNPFVTFAQLKDAEMHRVC